MQSDPRPLNADDKVLFLRRCRDDVPFFAKKCLKLIDETKPEQRLEPVTLRREQMQLVNLIHDLESQGKPQRIIILKARRIGFSMAIQVVGFHRCVFRQNHSALVVAHLKQAAERISKYSQRFNAHIPAALPFLSGVRDKTGDIVWRNGSSFRVETAGSKDALRSDGRTFGHLSEAAFYGSNRSATFESDAIRATLGSFVDHSGSCIVMESTSGGPAGDFYKRFMDAHTGKSDWVPVFYSFQNSSIYDFTDRASAEQREWHAQMMVRYRAGDQLGAAQCAAKLHYPDLWMRRAFDFGLTADQTLWAIAKVNGDCKGDVRLFDREYPVSVMAAFNSGTTTPFDPLWLERVRNTEHPDETIIGGDLSISDSGEFKLDAMGGSWHFYRQPKPGHEYVIGVDPATGVSQDYSCAQVFDRHTHEQVAEYYSNTVYPDLFADQVLMAAKVYNNAFLVPEQCPQGHILIRRLLDAGYLNVYVNTLHDSRSNPNAWMQKYGYVTSRAAKSVLFHELFSATRSGLTVYSRRFLLETQTFIEKSPGVYDHMTNQHSDAIVALALAVHGHLALSPPAPLPIEQQVAPSFNPVGFDKALERFADPRYAGKRRLGARR